jgi:hypothetical protein
MGRGFLSRAVSLALLAVVQSATATAQRATTAPHSDVRQLVAFHFLPGRADSAFAIYERVLVPAYRDDSAMLRFRGYREAESPEPLDLLIVSHFDGMAGMDASNRALRKMSAGGRPVFAWYGALSDIAQSHRDEFAEMLPELGDSAATGDSSGGLVVIERVRVLPTERSSYERLVRARARAVERARPLVRWSETGRFLVSDGWDYVRFVGIDSLADWQRYRAAMEETGAWGELDRLVVARKTMIVRLAPTLSVR